MTAGRARAVGGAVLPFPRDRRVQRLVQVVVGQTLYGVGICLLVRANLGLDPWDVLHQGISKMTGIPIGLVSNGIGALLLLLWIPLRQRPGVGTLFNVVIVGVAADAALDLVPQLRAMAIRVPVMISGVALIAAATALYIGAGLGPGPRDGLMTGLHARGLGSIRVVRTCIECTVLCVGWLLGGSVGIGTLLFAATIGVLVQFMLRPLTLRPAPAALHAALLPRDPRDTAAVFNGD